MVLVIEAMNGYAAVVRDATGHRSHPCDDACRWVITHDGVRCFAVFAPATQDEDLTVTHRHAAALLHTGTQK